LPPIQTPTGRGEVAGGNQALNGRPPIATNYEESRNGGSQERKTKQRKRESSPNPFISPSLDCFPPGFHGEEVLRESLDGGEKVVVFTQYLGMIAILVSPSSSAVRVDGLVPVAYTGVRQPVQASAAMDRYLNVTEARAELLGLVEKLHRSDKVIITKRGVPRAVIVDFDRYRLMEDLAWVHQDPARKAEIEEGWRQFEEGRTVRAPKGAAPTVETVRRLVRKHLRRRAKA
ncbi:MAG: type II toxin-antitoxin system prevent-host-death family antitoxin, partial [Candidatus Binatia bacterium]